MIELCVTNLGKYNEGELIYSRLVLPATTEEICAAYDEIGVADGTMYEEAFISDYETDINGLIRKETMKAQKPISRRITRIISGRSENQ